VDVLPSGEVITASSGHLRVYDQQYGQEIQHPLSDLCKGWMRGVAVDGYRSTVVAIQDRDSRPGVLHVHEACYDGWTHKKFDMTVRPWSVACAGDGNVIVGSYNQSLYKYNTHSRVIWKKKLSFCPGYITTDHDKRILVSDTASGCVRVYNQDGGEIFSFPAATDQRKLAPLGICVDSENNILVVDKRTKTVVLYDDRFNYIRDVLHVNGVLMYVALYQDKYVTLSGYKNGKTSLSLHELYQSYNWA
jgi:hypothetical protein